MNLFTKQSHRGRKKTYGYQKGREGRRYKLGVWDLQIQITTSKINNKVLLMAQGTIFSILNNL